ncbi:hypothetical protein [Vibrio cyclitrophicus]|nr:hypothetical protein [Vibrio cyclitrophicus]
MPRRGTANKKRDPLVQNVPWYLDAVGFSFLGTLIAFGSALALIDG